MAFDANHPLHPDWRFVIDTPEKARRYGNVLKAKIAVQIVLLGVMLYLAWFAGK